jgi:hypothetical protein
MPGGDGGDPFGGGNYRDPFERLLGSQEAQDWAFSGEFFSDFESSNVRAISYDHADRVLAVEYRDGARWYYSPVTLTQAMELYEAPSKGTYIWDHVRIRGTVHAHQVDAWPGGL